MEPILFLENPSDRKFYQWGSSVELLKKFFDFLDREADNISEIYLSMRLYNNGVLHEKMKAFANRGIKVTVISIPLEGYDNNYPKKIYEYGTNETYCHNVTIYSLAKEIYEDIERWNNENYILRIFDHTYVRISSLRYKNSFSERMLPYSLFTKSIYIKYKDGKTVTGLTSSDLAVGYQPKDEIMLLVEDTLASRETSEMFFSNLLMHSVRLSDWRNPHPNYHYEMETVDGGNVGMNYFTAPFIQDSPIKMEEKIRDIIFGAQERIYICAEHLSAFSYHALKGSRPGIFGAVFDKCRQGIKAKCLSQAYMDTDGDSRGQRKPISVKDFTKLIKQVDQLETCNYSVNKYVHAKFIVVDNIIIVGTGDYTPTEFIYGNVSTDKSMRSNSSGISYKGKYSKVNHYIIMEDGGLAEQLIGFFNEIIAQPDTYVHGTATVEKKYATGTWNGEREETALDKKIYAVKIGRKTGIFNEWSKCSEQTNKYPNAKYHSFEYRGELEEEPEDVPGSLRYAIKEAEEYLGDLVYLGANADYLADVNWVEDGFLPFGNESEAEDSEFFSDQIEDDEGEIEDVDEEHDEWLADNRNTLDALGEFWEIEYWKIAEDMKKCVELIMYGHSNREKMAAASDLKRHLERCLDDVNLSKLTAIYKDKKAKNILGYDTTAISTFVEQMLIEYPKP